MHSDCSNWNEPAAAEMHWNGCIATAAMRYKSFNEAVAAYALQRLHCNDWNARAATLCNIVGMKLHQQKHIAMLTLQLQQCSAAVSFKVQLRGNVTAAVAMKFLLQKRTATVPMQLQLRSAAVSIKTQLPKRTAVVQYLAFNAESVEIDERMTKLRAFKQEKSLTREFGQKCVQN